MTEQEWSECEDPRPMWEHLSGGQSARKTRLFVCACCRRVWDLLTDERSRHAVAEAERYADGLSGPEALRAARRKADAAYQWSRKKHGTACANFIGAAHLALQATASALRFDPREDEFLRGVQERKELTERKARSGLTREIFGNPFRPVTVKADWLSSTVVGLAQAIYDERAFDRMPILADALEDAGCTDGDVLGHGRQPGEHVRGCWVVDLVLGKSQSSVVV